MFSRPQYGHVMDTKKCVIPYGGDKKKSDPAHRAAKEFDGILDGI
jgi:hypothetical protein